ncbi:MAG: hypothetical protein A3F53_00180 [Candidatus Zambryskibacteria bacterium RIFCSPHIGHO2_12_FULL_48_10]|nr:MAG: hypothetical protein A3F53_00180 [Candidatus Zambryskibacteria bacterium RIFCSPHIGHO2_12_FULL_48_10]
MRLKDIIELLAGAHIGASGHHIISQGEADKVVSANPKDRKAMVEDALGLKLYQYKKAESERKLKKTFENVAQVKALRKEIAPHLRFLEKQVEKLAKTEGLREDLVKLALEYFKREDSYITSAKKEIEEERKPLSASLAKLEKELAEAKEVLAEQGSQEKKEYLILELEKELSASRAIKDASSRELGRVEGLMDAQSSIVRKQQELAASNEHKVIPLKDVEALYKEIEIEKDAPGILERIKAKFLNFLKERRETVASNIIEEAKKYIEELREEKLGVERKQKDAEEKEKKLQADYETLKKEVERAKDSDSSAQIAVFRIMSEENSIRSKLSLLKAREEKVGLEETEFKRELTEIGHLAGGDVLKYGGLEFSKEEGRVNQEERKRTLGRLKIRLEDSSIAGAEEVKKEHLETSERDAFLARELLDLEKSAESLNGLIKDLEDRLATEFKTGLQNINEKFDKLFTSMFGGGEAHLTLVKNELPVEEGEEGEKVEEGLDIKVSLPKKKIRNLMMLSGGERALTSIALIFAISQVNPPPFIILDETDAALDESNSKKYGDLVELLSEKSQLILITHNRETMSRAGVIYGVTMSGNGISKLLSISFDEAVEVAK